MARTADSEVTNRRKQILYYLEKNLYISVKDLSIELGVSEVTIRRDLSKLSDQGIIDRSHGGAISKEPISWPISEHQQDKLDRKPPTNEQYITSLAMLAVDQINMGDVILLSSGKITEKIAELLLRISDATIITNCVTIFDLLRKNRNIHLLSTGGELYHSQNTLVGPLAEASLQDIRVDKYFLEPSGLTQDMEIYCQSLADYSIQREMIHVAREVIIVADASKFESIGIKSLGDISIASKILLSSNIDTNIIQQISKQEIEVVKQ